VVPTSIDSDFKITRHNWKQLSQNKMMWFSTPCNPSGSVYDREELTALAKYWKNIHTFTLLPMKSMSISISQGTFVASHLSGNVRKNHYR
jgi:hypothetical protein